MILFLLLLLLWRTSDEGVRAVSWPKKTTTGTTTKTGLLL
jgi:hypothetical protein